MTRKAQKQSDLDANELRSLPCVYEVYLVLMGEEQSAARWGVRKLTRRIRDLDSAIRLMRLSAGRYLLGKSDESSDLLHAALDLADSRDPEKLKRARALAQKMHS